MSHTVFTMDKKRKMASKISDIRNKSDLKMIKCIIFEENPDISVNKESGGMLMFFQNMTQKTYERLDKLLTEIDNNALTKTTTGVDTHQSDKLSDNYNNSSYLTSHTRFRYTNKERSIMRKKEYDTMITNQNNMIINALKSSDQFVDNSSACLESDQPKPEEELTNDSLNNNKSKKTTQINKKKTNTNSIFSKN